MTVEEENVRLRAEVESLRRELAAALALVAELRQQVVVLEARVAELEGHSSGGPPAFVKSNRPKREGPKAPRKKRDPRHNHARRREKPTSIVQHAYDRCPECNYLLRGQSLDYSRQVIELPAPRPVEVTEHRVIKRYCPHCKRWKSPRLDLTGQVLGQSRIGVRLVSLIAYLRTTLRLPLRAIETYLETIHRCKLSQGELVGLLDQVREVTKSAVEKLREEVQAGVVVHADETGWREDGQNGYVWAFVSDGLGAEVEDGANGQAKPLAIRYYEYDKSRAQAVVRRILASEANRFKGHLVSDFYCGYNDYECPKQRCWSHFLRDLHDLKEQPNQEAEVVAWTEAVRGLYDEAVEWLEHNQSPDRALREGKYEALVRQAHDLGLKYAQNKGHACCALAKRILRHQDELFQFVLVEGLSANNNLAERSIRPLVIVRKISGGTRSENGSKTRMALLSLFGTWAARGLDPFLECFNLLSQKTSTAPA